MSKRYICSLVLLFAALWSARADYRLPLQPPGSVVSKTVRVEVGRKVEILLEARGNGGRDVAFLIRENPTRGKLGALEKVRPGVARITYTHNGRKGPGADSFRYAVQASGAPVSAAGKITIEAVEGGPRIEFPSFVDFGRVTLGQSTEQNFEILNAGGGLIRLTLSCDPPFKLIGEPQVELTPGKKAYRQIQFQPQTRGEYTAQLRVSGVGGGHADLQGTCAVPFESGPDTLRLTSDPEGIRAGRGSVQSATESELICSLQYEGPIHGPAELRLAPLDSGYFDLWASETDLAGGTGKVTIQSEGYTHTIDVTVDPVEVRFRAGPERSYDLGVITPGSRAEKEIAIENLGAQSIALQIEAPNLQLEPSDSAIQLQPQERRTVTVRWSDPGAKISSRTIRVTSPFAAPQQIELMASFEPGARATASPVLTATGSAPAETAGPQEQLPQNAIKKIEVVRRTEREIDLRWAIPEGAAGFILELQVFEKQSGGIQMTWRKVEPDALRMNNGFAEMDLKGLLPGAGYAFRIRSKDAAGKLSEPSSEIRVGTVVPKPFHFPWGWIGFVAVLAGGGVVIYRRWVAHWI